MTRFFFWNFDVQGRVEAPAAIVARTALRHDADLVILAESKVDPGLILEALNEEGTRFESTHFPGDRFQIFSRFPARYLVPFQDESRMSVHRLQLPGRMEILVGVIHFHDRRNKKPEEQHSLAIELAGLLREAEDRAGHRRTVLLGDFNMNPFEGGMIDASGFSAMMTKALARKHAEDSPNRRPRFYNPMWGLLGDMTDGPPGTFYYRQKENTNIYWHMLDQVLVRPELIDTFIGSSLQVLDRGFGPSGEIALLRENTRHPKLTVSDHLPLIFTLDLLRDTSHEHST